MSKLDNKLYSKSSTHNYIGSCRSMSHISVDRICLFSNPWNAHCASTKIRKLTDNCQFKDGWNTYKHCSFWSRLCHNRVHHIRSLLYITRFYSTELQIIKTCMCIHWFKARSKPRSIIIERKTPLLLYYFAFNSDNMSKSLPFYWKKRLSFAQLFLCIWKKGTMYIEQSAIKFIN